jgi:hypothetical protein
MPILIVDAHSYISTNAAGNESTVVAPEAPDHPPAKDTP